MATRICTLCTGTGQIDDFPEGQGLARCTNCNGSGQIVIETRRDDLTPGRILELQKAVEAADTNPKDLAARNRVAMCLLPSAGKIHGAHAMMDGERKYGPYNWRQKKVQAMVYAHAVGRHLENWVDGQDLAPDSLAHHLGHIIANCSILLDAMECGVLVDDRPVKGKAAEILERLGK